MITMYTGGQIENADNAIIFIDDERWPGVYLEKLVYKNSSQIFICRKAKHVFELYEEMHKNGYKPYMISFDNDLGVGELEGADIARALIEMDLDGKISIHQELKFHVHSMNSVRNPYIKSIVISYMKHKFGEYSGYIE